MGTTHLETITPEEIREIRHLLGLTQAEAGQLLGGGPRAFAKYEAGTVAPSAGLIRLLRLLAANPSALAAVGGPRRDPNPSPIDAPFVATGDDIMRLREWELPQFLRALLHAEAEAEGLPLDDIHVAEAYSVADGAEDAHIRWRGGPPRSAQLPARYTQFQIKTGAITPAKAAAEVRTKDGRLKEMVGVALERGAHYVLLCTTSLTAKKAERIAKRLRETIAESDLPEASERVHVWDADQVAAWISRYPVLVTRLKERTRPNSTKPFRSCTQWADREEHVLSPFVDDERLPKLTSGLVDDLARPGTVLRVLGAAGVGKSRLVLESLRSDDALRRHLDEFVLYVDRSEVEESAVSGAVRTLADTGARAVVVVDECPSDAHQRLARMVRAPQSRVSLVTIDNDEARSASAHDRSVVHVEYAPPAVTEAIIDGKLPTLPSEDRRRLLVFSRGFPTIAVRVVNAWAQNTPMPYATDDDFVRAFVTGRDDPEPDVTIRTAMLVAALGKVRHPPDHSDFPKVAGLARHITPGDLHAALDRLIDRGVVQRRGRVVVLQPRPVAMRLTEWQWRREWMPEQWLAILTGDQDPDLKREIAHQLTWINGTDVASQVAELVLRPGGPLDGLEQLSRHGNALVLYSLAAVDAQRTADCIGRTLDDVEDLRTLPAEVRRTLVASLDRIAFASATFSDAALLMFRLATAETDTGISNNATGQFAGLFRMIGGATAANGTARIAFLRGASNTNDGQQRAVVINALLAGASTMPRARFIGAETHGSRPAITPWHPATGREAADYITYCVQRLAEEACAQDEAGAAARTGLGNELRRLVGIGLVQVVEQAVDRVKQATGTWPEAIESLGHFLQFDAKDASSDVYEKVQHLIERLRPNTLPERIRALVSRMSPDYPNGEQLDHDERADRQLAAVHDVATDALAEQVTLAQQLPSLCRGSQRWAAIFGEYIATRIESPDDWLQRIVMALRELPAEERNFELLSGLVTGLSERDRDAVESFKRQLADSSDLATALPEVCARLGLTDSDVHLAVTALRAGRLPPQSLRYWAYGDVLAKLKVNSLAGLFDALLDHSKETVPIVAELLGMLAHSDAQRLEDLRPQLLRLGSFAGSISRSQDTMARHHMTQLFKWLLGKDRDDDDARTLALTLSRALADDDGSHGTTDLLSSLLPDLLSRFPEIAWPLIGRQVVKSTGAAWSLREILSGAHVAHREGAQPPILSLSPDTLFAWCAAYPDDGPACAARMLPILDVGDPEAGERPLHPLFRRLLDQFGDREDVLDVARRSIRSYRWVGSLTGYFARYRSALATLRSHPIPRVARWARRMETEIEMEIVRAQHEDDERAADSEV